MTTITDNTVARRYEMLIEGHTAFVTYQRDGDVVRLNHAEVPRALEGRGHGGALVKATLDAVRAEGLKVIPRCSFVAAYIRRHPEYADMLVR